ncbi:MAG: zinc ribbon domain-containing protein [Armatimonadetes bacterium]|nr:zinc ribbon domain-containing protein [Armatimonadota bacterium]
MYCQQCNEVNLEGSTYCSKCGSRMEVKAKPQCPFCGGEVRTTSKFCIHCGSTLPYMEEGARSNSLKSKTIYLKDQFGNLIRKGNYKKVLQDKENPATKAFIDFVAWGIAHFFGFAAFIGAVTVLGFLLGPWGIVLTAALAYVYATHKDEIRRKVEEMKSGSESRLEPPSRRDY